MPRFYIREDSERVFGGPESVDSPSTRDETYRDNYHEDVARLVHSPSFRRLARKRQLLPSENSDFVRTRLTHSNEVAQIATSIGAFLNNTLGRRKDYRLNADLLIFAGLAHDIGHPPFGHLGEQVLNDRMYDAGGFEGNAQTLRIICNLERRLAVSRFLDQDDLIDLHTLNDGINPTLRSVAAILKYDQRIEPCNPAKNLTNKGKVKAPRLVKGYYSHEEEIVSRVRELLFTKRGIEEGPISVIEKQIMDFADDIAYSIYDLEDCLRSGVLRPETILSLDKRLLQKITEEVAQDFFKDQSKERLISAGISNEEAAKKMFSPELISEVIVDIFSSILTGDDFNIPKPAHAGEYFFSYAENYALTNRLTSDNKVRRKFTELHIRNMVSKCSIDNSKHGHISHLEIDALSYLKILVMKKLNYHLVIRSDLIKSSEKFGAGIIQEVFDSIFLPGDEFKSRGSDLTGYHLLPVEMRDNINDFYLKDRDVIRQFLYKGRRGLEDCISGIYPQVDVYDFEYMLSFADYNFRYRSSLEMYRHLFELSDEGPDSNGNIGLVVAALEERRISTKRLICDFVSGMTDRGILEFHARLKGGDKRLVLDEFHV